jgi:hypothetical protein
MSPAVAGCRPQGAAGPGGKCREVISVVRRTRILPCSESYVVLVPRTRSSATASRQSNLVLSSPRLRLRVNLLFSRQTDAFPRSAPAATEERGQSLGAGDTEKNGPRNRAEPNKTPIRLIIYVFLSRIVDQPPRAISRTWQKMGSLSQPAAAAAFAITSNCN